MDQKLRELESIAESLIVSQSVEKQKQALEALHLFSSLEYLPQCKYILDNSKSQSAIYFATTALQNSIGNNWSTFNQDLNNAVELKNYLLIYLWAKGNELQPFALNALIKLVCLVSKLSWLNEAQRNLVDQVEKFLGSALEHRVIGFKILEFLIEEFNTKSPHQTYSIHRKISNLFRDHTLLKIFEFTLETMQLIARDRSQFTDVLVEMTFKLFIQILSYDFFATLSYSNEDTHTVQIPSAWKSKFEDGTLIILLFELYSQYQQPPRSVKILECLSLLASVRTSLFSSGDVRTHYISKLVLGMSSILQLKREGLSDTSNHHQFCRILARMKANFLLSQIAQADGFPQWLHLLREFTCGTFHAQSNYSQNSILYLLNFWSKIATSLEHFHDESRAISDSTLLIAQQYFRSKIIPTEEDELLNDEDQLIEQLEALPVLVRSRYSEFSSELISVTEPLFIQFQNCIQTRSQNINVIEGQLAWIFYIIGTAVSGRVTTTNSESDIIDIELSILVFKFLTLQDLRIQMNLDTDNVEHLEKSILVFLSSFKRVFLEKSQISPPIFARLKEKLGIDNLHSLTELLLRKVVTNLTTRFWAQKTEIISLTLTFFFELVSSTSAKILSKIEVVQFLLSRHNDIQQFAFLNFEDNFRNRSKYYLALGKLLFMSNVHPDNFEKFMIPFRSTFDLLSSQSSIDALRHSDFKKCFVGLLRDLIGIAGSCQTRLLYDMFFEWLFPKYIDIIGKCSAIFYDSPAVIAPLLRFIVQLSSNKDGRMKFDCSSPNGFLLFKEVAKIIIEYGRRLLEFNPNDSVYDKKLKGISLLLTIMANMSIGNYIPFSLFELYGDKSLSDALTITLKLSLCISLEDILSFPKLTPSYFAFINALSQYHMKFLVSLDSQSFSQIITTVKESVTRITPDTTEFQKCCQFLELVSTYYYYNINKDKDYIHNFKIRFNESNAAITHIMGSLFHLSIFSDVANHWEISKALFALIVTHPQQFSNLRDEILNNQPQDKKQPLIEAFTILMKDIETNLDTQNREQFSKNFTSFRSNAKKCLQTDA